MEPKKLSVIFQPSGRRINVDSGGNILDAARTGGEPVESVCGGKQTCGKCKVRVSGPVSPFSSVEKKFLSEKERKAGYRLACATRILGDIRIDLLEENQRIYPAIRKGVREAPFDLNPAVKMYPITLVPPTLRDSRGDFERVKRSLAEGFGLSDLSADLTVLHSLPQILRTNDWKAHVWVWMDRKILEVCPATNGARYGLAVDIGTTTIGVYLCDLGNGKIVATESMMNPQVKYGEDLMSRISYAMADPPAGLREMQGALLEGLNDLIRSICASAGIATREILEMTVVGNTAMHHIFLGMDPRNLGCAPFAPVIQGPLDVGARDLGLRIHPAANVHVLPIEAGFVGADNVGVLIAERPYARDEMVLIIDAGTNGELVLGNRQRLLSSSCATGPAFEGAHLRFGMRAAVGAIEKVRVDPASLDVKFKVIGSEKWSDRCRAEEIRARGICGSGMIDAVAEMLTARVLMKSGRFNPDLRSPRLRKGKKGYEFVIARAEETAMDCDLTVCAADIRALQLAKGAIYAGAKVMMKMLRVKKLDRVVLAGGFGNTIDGEHAMRLGMLPDCDLKKVDAVGNAAGDGARIVLLDRDKRKEAARVARQVEYIELTTSREFSREFIEAMPFPHMKDAFPHLPEGSGP